MTQLQQMTKAVIEIFAAYGAQGTKDWDYDIAAHDLQYQIGKLTKGILQLKEYRHIHQNLFVLDRTKNCLIFLSVFGR